MNIARYALLFANNIFFNNYMFVFGNQKGIFDRFHPICNTIYNRNAFAATQIDRFYNKR